jgi:arginyl-tRNA synthetase
MYKNEIDPRCLLCAKEEENIEHFILNCKSLSNVTNITLQELITTFNRLGIEFDELSASTCSTLYIE